MILTVGCQTKNGTESLRTQTWMIMKLTIALLLFFTFQVSAIPYAQKITIVKDNIHLSEVFKDIEQQTGFHFFYDKDDIQKTSPFDVAIKDATLEQALSTCLRGQQLNYTIVKKTVVIRHENKTAYFQSQATLTPVEAIEPPPIEIHGRVVNQQGEPLPNVSVLIAGTKIGTTTDNEGRFTLAAPNNKNIVLEISSVGFQTKTIKIGKQTEINVMLEQEVTGLSDVVVVGYGTQRKKDQTTASANINAKELTSPSTGNVGNMLEGLVPGLSVKNSEGTPGGSPIIRIRGASSLQGSNKALIVVDGLQGVDLADLNPNDIQSMEVLKGPSATAIYGSEGANGVILVTTKKGRSKTPEINFMSTYTTSSVNGNAYKGTSKNSLFFPRFFL